MAYSLKKTWKDGTSYVVLEPQVLMERLCALVPRPQKHLVTYTACSARRRFCVRGWCRGCGKGKGEGEDVSCRHAEAAVFTPTHASWLDRIEPLFAALRYCALNNSDYQDHEETRRAINADVAWRNRRPDNAKLRRLEKHEPTSGSRH